MSRLRAEADRTLKRFSRDTRPTARRKGKMRRRGKGKKDRWIAKRRTKKSQCLVGVRSRLLITILDVVMPSAAVPRRAKLKHSRFSVSSRRAPARHNGEKPIRYSQSKWRRATKGGRDERRKGWRRALKANPRHSLARRNGGPDYSLARASPSLSSPAVPLRAAPADTDRLPPRGNYERRGRSLER